MSSSGFRMKIREEIPRLVNEKIEYINIGGDPVYALLTLSLEELRIVKEAVKCPYCRAQMLAEIRTLENALNLAQIAFIWRYSNIWGRVKLVLRAIYHIAKIQIIHIAKVF